MPEESKGERGTSLIEAPKTGSVAFWGRYSGSSEENGLKQVK